jgi:hypothetical protein
MLQTVSENHEEISVWTVDMNSALASLAQQVVDSIGVPITEDEKPGA